MDVIIYIRIVGGGLDIQMLRCIFSMRLSLRGEVIDN